MLHFDIGNTLTCSVTFTDDGVLEDPASVTFAFKKPDDTTTTLAYGTDIEVVKDSVGKYHVDLEPGAAEGGNWRWRWEGPESAAEGEFYVRPSAFL